MAEEGFYALEDLPRVDHARGSVSGMESSLRTSERYTTVLASKAQKAITTPISSAIRPRPEPRQRARYSQYAATSFHVLDLQTRKMKYIMGREMGWE